MRIMHCLIMWCIVCCTCEATAEQRCAGKKDKRSTGMHVRLSRERRGGGGSDGLVQQPRNRSLLLKSASIAQLATVAACGKPS